MADRPTDRKRRTDTGPPGRAALAGLALLGVAAASARGQQPARPIPPPPAPMSLPALPPEAVVLPVPPRPVAAPVLAPLADTTGLVPLRPEAATPPRPAAEVARQVGGLLEMVQDPEAELSVVVGRSKLLKARPGQNFTRIAVANPNVADVVLLDNARLLNLYGLSFGTTNVTIFDANDQPLSVLVRVTIDAQDLMARMRQVFPSADVSVRQVGPQIILEGQVPDAKTMAEVLQLVESELIGAAAAVAPGGQAPTRLQPVERAAFRQDQPGAAGAGPIVTAPSPESTEIPGSPAGPLAPPGAGRAMPVAAIDRLPVTSDPSGLGASPVQRSGGGGIIPGTIINRVHVPGPRQVQLKVKIAELNRTAIRQLGVNFKIATHSTNFATQVGAIASGLPQLVGVFNSGEFSLYLNALRRNDLAKILAEPNLVTLDGQPARFLSGGEIPYQTVQPATGLGGTATFSIQFRRFGAIVEFVPHILANDVIRLDVEPVFSEPDFALQANGQPTINERSARTVVELREGQTLAIAGLLQTRTNASTQRIPFLGDLPIAGPLFSNNSIQTIETELVVLVTPEFVAPAEACELPPSPGDLVTEPNDCEFFFLGRIEGRTGAPYRATVQELDPFNCMRYFRSEGRWLVGPHGHAD